MDWIKFVAPVFGRQWFRP